MKRALSRGGPLLLAFVTAACALVACRPPQPPPEPDAGCIKGPTLTEAESGSTVAPADDELVTVTLETLGSAGYAWTVSGIDSTVLKLVGREEVFGSTPGQPDKQILRFAGVARGTSPLALANGRPWESNAPPVKTFEASVSVRGPYTGCYQQPAAPARATGSRPLSPAELPSAFTYCDSTSCTPVKEQRLCGSCWAFATTGVLEQLEKKVDGVTRDLSEQHLVSCNTSGYSCNGGAGPAFPWYLDANDQMGAVGTVYEEDYPYTATSTPCSMNKAHHERIDSWQRLAGTDPPALKQAIYDNGPIWVTVCADIAFESYRAGIFEGAATCTNHAVVLTGWDDATQTWLLRNSWGEGWGEQGYMRIAYGANGVGFYAASARYTRKVVAAEISAGDGFSLFLRADGTLWAAGANNYGQLGDDTTTDRSSFVQVLSGVSSVATGWGHTLALMADGTLWATGRNSHGQLGDGTTTNRSSFVKVLSGVSSVANGGDHTLAVKSDGTLWVTGSNADGELGDGTTTDRSGFVQVLSGVSAAAGSGRHSLALKSDGTLWATGSNVDGELGDGTTTSRSTFEQVLSGVASIDIGDYHSVALKSDGTVWTAGYNPYGQLGDGTTTNRSKFAQVFSGVSSIAAGSYNTLALKPDGTLWATGYNNTGQLGDGTTTNRSSFTQVLSGVSSVDAARNHTLVLKSDGMLWATGSNAEGQLGDGTTTDRLRFAPVPEP